MGVPHQATIREIRHDAWTLHPNDIVGRVWLIRKSDAQVDVFTVTCPHLGCPINHEGEKFVCPCHNGTFAVDGVSCRDQALLLPNSRVVGANFSLSLEPIRGTPDPGVVRPVMRNDS